MAGSVLGADLVVHPAEHAELCLPRVPAEFSVLRPTLILPGHVRVTVAQDMPYDVTARWWDSLTVAATMAGQWYASQVNGWPGGQRRTQ